MVFVVFWCLDEIEWALICRHATTVVAGLVEIQGVGVPLLCW
jgi:hypothetical protein